MKYEPVRRASPRVYGLARRVFQLLVGTLLRAEVSGVENVPLEGSFLAVVNHLGLADPTLIMSYFPRQMTVFAADKWRRVFPIRQIVETVGVIWVARGEADLSAIRQAVGTLKDGWPIGMAPEGTRSRTRTLQAGKVGAAYLADRAGVPILPVGIWGTERLTENLRRLRRTPVHMRIGPPFRLPDGGRADSQALKTYTEEIMCRIAALLPPEYRGVYADHPGVSPAA
ncbi:MAG: 1-acyl-sn-glycerol-3-phosphate acyltransferase [Anaerolineales bacterium]|nr:1-acyl-sn-glycerol-3-phosphate acyltransferase [Anaerolineales bacterium]